MSPEVGAVQHQVSVGDYGKRQASEVESFADHLGSDDEVDFARFHPLQKVGHGPFAPRGIRVHPQDSGFGKQGFDFFFDALGSESAPIPGGLAALRAGFGQVLVESAVVADELASLFVVGQRDVAVGTGLDPPAIHAGEHRSVSTAVLKDQDLLVVGQGLGHGSIGFGGERAHLLVQCLGLEGADRNHFRKCDARVALTEVDPLVFALGGVVPGFDRWGGGSQHNRDFFLLRQPHGDVAGVVARSGFLLFVAGFVFFVDHDKAEAVPRQQDARARGHYDARGGIGIQEVFPKGAPLAVGELVVPGHHPVGPEGPARALHHLRNQSDFRNHQ